MQEPLKVRPVVAWLKALFVMLVVAAINLAIWALTHQPRELPDWPGRINGFAFSAFQRYQSPHRDEYPSDEELNEDIRLMSLYTRRIRTYSSAESPTIPRIARANGIQVTAGAWLDRRWQKNEDEIAELIRLIGEYDNIDRAIVGNEVILRGDTSVRALVGYIDRARAQLKIPVSTAEPLDTWQRNPELIRHVDFVTVHILPYWERVPRKDAVGFVLGQLKSLRQIVDKVSPGKPIVVGEVGWPSNGDRKEYAQASLADEAHFLREWFNVAARENIDYYVMEAIDQPWKEQLSGRVEAYWGMFNASR